MRFQRHLYGCNSLKAMWFRAIVFELENFKGEAQVAQAPKGAVNI